MKVSVIAKNPWLLVFVWLALFSVQAVAAIDNAGVLDNVLARYANAASTWGNYITNRASWLFWTLVVIGMVFTFGFMALRKADLGEFFAEFARFTIFTGFFWWLLINGPTFATAIMDSLRKIGAAASGLPNALAPSGIVDIGFDIFSKVVDVSSVWSPVDSTVGLIIAAVILVVFALVGVNMLLLLIAGWMLAYAGIFFLGFGGSRWTSEIAIGYYKTVLNIAAQLFTMVLLVGIGKSVCDQYYANMSAGITLKEMGVMLVVAIILLALVNKVPGLIGSIAGGNTAALGSGLGAGTAMGAAMGAAAMAGAAISVAGQAIASTGANMAGGVQALMAAVSAANASEVAGAGSAPMMPSTGGLGGGGAPEGASPLAAAMGPPTNGAGSMDASDVSSMSVGAPRTGAGSDGRAGSGGGSGGAKSAQAAAANSKSDAPVATDGAAPGEVPKGSAFKAAGAMATKVGRVAAGTASNLAVGAYDVGKAKLDDLKGSALDRIGETTGGKIATAINARAAADKAPAPTFGGDSLSAAPDPADRESEVAAFRDRT